MKRTLVAIPLDAVASLGALGELGARLGGEYELAAQVIAERLDAIPGARLALRDAAVREAIGRWPELKITPACERLSDELDRYVTSSAWLEHDRHMPNLPQNVTEPRRRLLHRIARLTGGDGSLGARQIFNLMKSNPLSIS
jgi:hypothetical protein